MVRLSQKRSDATPELQLTREEHGIIQRLLAAHGLHFVAALLNVDADAFLDVAEEARGAPDREPLDARTIARVRNGIAALRLGRPMFSVLDGGKPS